MAKANDEKQLQQLADNERLQEEQQLADLAWLMEQAQFRRFMHDFLERARVFSLSMTGNSWTFFNEGRRSLGNMYFSEITEHTPELYLKMMNEALSRKQLNEEISDG